MPATRTARRASISVLLAFALLAAYVVGTHQGVRAASSLPADKMTATASKTSVQAPNSTVTVLTAHMKTSTPADLVLQMTSECTILSSIANTGSETQAYSAKVALSIWIDGKVIPVVPIAPAPGATPDDGNVVFCNREFQRTTVYDSQNESIKDVETTEQANAFNWVAMNVGNGTHTIEVKATFTDTNGADTFAHGVLGARSLNVNVTNYLIPQAS